MAHVTVMVRAETGDEIQRIKLLAEGEKGGRRSPSKVGVVRAAIQLLGDELERRKGKQREELLDLICG